MRRQENSAQDPGEIRLLTSAATSNAEIGERVRYRADDLDEARV